MKAVIIGASGKVGRRLFTEVSKNLPTIGTSSKGDGSFLRLDLSKPESFDYKLIGKGDVVYFTAAKSSPDEFKEDPSLFDKINLHGTSSVISRALENGAKVIFLSSDAVYGATEGSIDENSVCHPIGRYGELKLAVEKKFSNCDSFTSVRLSYILSGDDSFSKYLQNCAAKNIEAVVYKEFNRSIVFISDVIEGLLALSRPQAILGNIINFGGPELVSRETLAATYKSIWFPQLKYSIVEAEKAFFDQRPKTIEMVSNMFKNLLGREITSVQKAISLIADKKHML